LNITIEQSIARICLNLAKMMLWLIASAGDAEELADATRNRQAKCDQALAQVTAVELEGSGYYQNGRFFTGFPVIGHQNLMMAYGECRRSPLPSFFCPWDRRARGLFFVEAGAVLPQSKLRLFLADVKRLRDAAPKSSLCDLDLYTGFLMRFVKRATGAYLGTTQEGDSVMLDFTFSRGDNASEARLDGDVFQEIEQIAFWKYNATPHWGKNRNYVFEGVGGKYKDLGKFLDTKRTFDPDGLFSSAWSDAVLGIGGAAVVVDAPGCALEGLCRCWKDEHCAPEKKSFCWPGRVYSDARVCRIEA
jgi:L-gulonolactone oxidase